MSFRKHIGAMLLGNSSAQLIGAVGAVVLARLYTPSDFGQFAAILAVASILGSVASLRYDLSVLMSRSTAGAHYAAMLALLVAASTIAIAGGGAWVAASFGLFDTRHVIDVVLMAAGISIINTSSLTLSRNRRYGRQAAIGLARPTGLLALGVLFHWYPVSENSLVTASSLSLCMIGATLLLIEYRDYPWRRSLRKSRTRRVWLARYRDLPKYAAPAVLLNSVTASIQPVLMYWLFGPAVAGLFAMVTRIVGMPTKVIAGAVNTAYQREIAERRNHARPIRLLTLKTFALMSVIAVVVLLFLFGAVRYRLFDLVFLDEWQDLGVFALWASPMLLGRFVARSIAGFGVLGFSRIGLVFQAIQLVGVVLALLGAYAANASGGGALLTLSWALFFVSVLQVAAVFHVTGAVDRASSAGRVG
jgi:O-antigen/teichoic acid export membrane protein